MPLEYMSAFTFLQAAGDIKHTLNKTITGVQAWIPNYKGCSASNKIEGFLGNSSFHMIQNPSLSLGTLGQ